MFSTMQTKFFPNESASDNSSEEIPIFTESETVELNERLRNGEIFKTNRTGGCSGFIRLLNQRLIETLVTYDGVHWHLGFSRGVIIGSRLIDDIPEDIITWYNEVNGTSYKLISVKRNDVPWAGDVTFYVSED